VIATALLLLVQTVPTEEEILVIGRRFAALSASVQRDTRGRYSCALSGTSGSAKLDGSLCKTATQCVRKGAAEQAQIAACIAKRKPALLAEFRRSMGRPQ
jgi:hypothetical protein